MSTVAGDDCNSITDAFDADLSSLSWILKREYNTHRESNKSSEHRESNNLVNTVPTGKTTNQAGNYLLFLFLLGNRDFFNNMTLGMLLLIGIHFQQSLIRGCTTARFAHHMPVKQATIK